MAVHAPMPATSLYLNGGTLQQAAALRRAVEGATPGEACPPFHCRELIWAGSSTSGRRGLRRRGRAVGGNLCLLAALCGTPYAPDYRGAVLFLEEVGEEPYKLDRMIMQVRRGCASQRWPPSAAMANDGANAHVRLSKSSDSCGLPTPWIHSRRWWWATLAAHSRGARRRSAPSGCVSACRSRCRCWWVRRSGMCTINAASAWAPKSRWIWTR